MKTCIYIYHQAEVDIIAHWSFQMVIVLQMNIRTPFWKRHNLWKSTSVPFGANFKGTFSQILRFIFFEQVFSSTPIGSHCTSFGETIEIKKVIQQILKAYFVGYSHTV